MLSRAVWAKLLAAASIALAGLFLLEQSGALTRLELSAYDALLRARPQAPVDGRMLIVDETEDDLRRFGHPLPDEVLAQAVQALLERGAAVIGVDKYRDVPIAPGTERLERIVRDSRNVIWVMKFGAPGSAHVLAPAAASDAGRVGFSDIVDDEGGVVRRSLLQVDDGSRHWNSLSMSLALAYLAPRGIALAGDPQRSGGMRLGAAHLVPLESDDGGYSGMDAGGFQILLDYRGMPQPIARVTLSDIVDGKADPRGVAGRIAIIGSSADSLRDFFPTPFDALMTGERRTTGMELHAHLTGQLVRLGLGESEPVRTLSGRARWLVALPFALLGLLAYRLGAAAGLAYLLAGAAASASIGYAGMLRGFWFPPVAPALAFALAAVAGLAARLATERAERKTLMTLFARHVSPEVAQTLWSERAALLEDGKLKPLRMTATILFADVRGYTPLAQQLDALALAQWLGEFMDAMSRAVLHHHGIVRQFSGDALLAAFGAPFPRIAPEEIALDARNAVACALAMLEAHARLENTWSARGLPPTGLRIGIHTGPVVACSVGSAERLEYTLIGDVVNVAARLQTYEGAEPETRRILMSGVTAELVAGTCETQAIGALLLKGRSSTVEAFRVTGAA